MMVSNRSARKSKSSYPPQTLLWGCPDKPYTCHIGYEISYNSESENTMTGKYLQQNFTVSYSFNYLLPCFS